MANGTFSDSLFRGFEQGVNIAQQPLRQRSAQLGLQQQELGVQQGEAEQQRFLEVSNLQSLAQGAQEFLNTPAEQRPAFLANRNQRLIAEKRDNSDTLQMLRLNPQDQVRAAETALQIAVQRGIIKPPVRQQVSKVEQFKQNLQQSGIDPNSQRGIQATQDFAIGKRSPLVTVTTGEKAEGARAIAEAKEIGKFQGGRIKQIVDEGDKARNTLSTIEQLANIDVKKGFFEETKQGLARVLDGVGFQQEARQLVDLDASLASSFLSNKLTNDIVAGFKGVQTDSDVARVKRTVPAIKDTQKAFEFKINSIKASLLRSIQKQEFIEDQMDAGATPSKAFREWNKFIRRTPSLGMVRTIDSTIPTFFFQYRDAVRKGNPNLSEQDIIDGWLEDAK